ncbi:intraflagellar transport protein 20 homolog isoform X1 [Adelges cooleyi]|uniref:intraflagellar transport protein 20 homolog isoform X1 n=3 Tax=Adelges cooleyi TaxID=133065 RepID=UPI0021809842|nr:intraflagellar transport protein 20 homolog isoform X1 [Adelges cooleyi]
MCNFLFCFIRVPTMDSAPVSDVVCIDDMGKARVMDPLLADKVSGLKEQCDDFMRDMDNYSGSVDGFIAVMENLAKQVEQEKREAIIASNQLASLTNKTEERQAMLQTEIEQKTLELERYKTEHRSLQKIESEQQDLINHLSFQY